MRGLRMEVKNGVPGFSYVSSYEIFTSIGWAPYSTVHIYLSYPTNDIFYPTICAGAMLHRGVTLWEAESLKPRCLTQLIFIGRLNQWHKKNTKFRKLTV